MAGDGSDRRHSRAGGNHVESEITRKSAGEMALKGGDAVKVVIKSTEVMLRKDCADTIPETRMLMSSSK